VVTAGTYVTIPEAGEGRQIREFCSITDRQETGVLRGPQRRFVIARGLTPGEY
jgi:hypothetical protein